jgi:TolA-binding protein
VPGRAHLLGYESYLQARQRELLSTGSMRYSDYLHQTAQRYFNSGYKQEGIALYKRNVSLFCDIHTRNSQREIAYYCIDTNDYEGLDGSVQNLVKNYSDGFDVSSDIFDIAQRFTRNKKTPEAAKLYQFAIDTFAGTDGAMRSQRELAFIELEAGRLANADVSVDLLINTYSKRDTLPGEIQNIAGRYTRAKLPDKARKLYQYVINTWPKSNNAIFSQREIAYISLDADDMETARKEIDGIINVFAGTNTLPAELYNIALRLGEKGLKADAIKLHQYNADKFPKEAAAMRSQAQVVQLNIRDGNNAGAEAAYSKLLETFKDRPTLPDEIIKVADAYLDVNNFDKAQQVNQSVIDKWPKTTSAMNAQLGIIKVHFAKDDSSNANSALDTLIADYKDNDQLPRAVLMFGEGYYNQGVKLNQSKAPPGIYMNPSKKAVPEDKDKAQNKFKQSLAIWLKIAGPAEANSIKADYAMTAEYYDYAGVCSNRLGEYEKAISYYEHVLEKWPKYDAAWNIPIQIAQIYERLQADGTITGQKADDLIKAAYQKAIDNYPDSPAAKAAKVMIDKYEQSAKRAKQAVKTPAKTSLIISDKGGRP